MQRLNNGMITKNSMIKICVQPVFNINDQEVYYMKVYKVFSTLSLYILCGYILVSDIHYNNCLTYILVM